MYQPYNSYNVEENKVLKNKERKPFLNLSFTENVFIIGDFLGARSITLQLNYKQQLLVLLFLSALQNKSMLVFTQKINKSKK